MKHKMYLIAVLVLIGTYPLFGQKPMEEDPNVMWTYGNASFSTYPAIHPNGNVLIGDKSKGDVIELNGLTGELIRRIPVPVSDIDPNQIAISKDGTRLVIAKKVVDYLSGTIICDLPETTSKVKFLHPDNNQLVIRLYNQNEFNWIVWNVNEKTSIGYKISTFVTSIEVSNDGKYLAVATLDSKTPEHTHFYLYDAQTMEQIRELENVPAEGRTIEFIQFSENAKYVGYGQKTGGTPKATFFTCELPYKKWEIINPKTKNYGADGLGFIQDNYVYLSCIWGTPNNNSAIYDIKNDKIIYETDLYHSYFPVFNPKYNNIVINGALALDFNKILNSVSVDEPNDLIAKFQTEYSKGNLTIKNYETTANSINITVNDLQGKVVFNRPIKSGSDILEISIKLQNGIYILQVQDGKQNYSQKFIVTE